MVSKVELVLCLAALHLLASHLHLFDVPVSVSVVSPTSDGDIAPDGSSIALYISSSILTVVEGIGREALPALENRLRVLILIVRIVLLVLLLFLVLLALLSTLLLRRFSHLKDDKFHV